MYGNDIFDCKVNYMTQSIKSCIKSANPHLTSAIFLVEILHKYVVKNNVKRKLFSPPKPIPKQMRKPSH